MKHITRIPQDGDIRRRIVFAICLWARIGDTLEKHFLEWVGVEERYYHSFYGGFWQIRRFLPIGKCPRCQGTGTVVIDNGWFGCCPKCDGKKQVILLNPTTEFVSDPTHCPHCGSKKFNWFFADIGNNKRVEMHCHDCGKFWDAWYRRVRWIEKTQTIKAEDLYTPEEP